MTPVLDGLSNLRDLGGLPLRTGGRTAHGVLLRSEVLTFASPSDVAHLVHELGVRLVLDLRTPAEIAAHPRPLVAAGVETVDLTVIGVDRDHLLDTPERAERRRQAYLGYLADLPQNLVTAARRVAEPAPGPVLVHCLSGKDRTGVLVALLLDAVGVEHDAIVADYLRTADGYPALLRRRLAARGVAMPADITHRLPLASALRAVLQHVGAEHGGAAGWFRAHGLTVEELAGMRGRLRARPGVGS